MPRRITLQAYSYNELKEDAAKAEAISQLKTFEITEPLAILEALYTEKGLYIPSAFIAA